MFNIFSKAKWFNHKVLPFRGRGFTFIVFCLVLYFTNVIAQPFSYVYIQGDKTIPFYVKEEGKMQPRYGKNHCIVSLLAPGMVNLEILFQQNIFPPQKFAINVGENDARGFLLCKQDDSFVLYDLQKKNYIKPNPDK